MAHTYLCPLVNTGEVTWFVGYYLALYEIWETRHDNKQSWSV